MVNNSDSGWKRMPARLALCGSKFELARQTSDKTGQGKEWTKNGLKQWASCSSIPRLAVGETVEETAKPKPLCLLFLLSLSILHVQHCLTDATQMYGCRWHDCLTAVT